MSTEQKFVDAVNKVIQNGGGTFHASGTLTAPAYAGFWVGGLVPTELISFDAETMTDENKAVVARAIMAFVDANKTCFGDGRMTFVGLWLDKGTLYVDVSQFIDTREEAIKLGKERGELSIYDNAAEDVLWLNEEVA